MNHARACLVASVVLAMTAVASAQVATWNYNYAAFADPFPATTGSGSMTLIGGTTFVQNTGSPQDPGVPNNGVGVTNYPAPGTGSGTAGVEFTFSTLGFEDIRFLFDQRHSNTSSRHVRADYSVDGGESFIAGPIFETPGGDTWNLDRELNLIGVPGAGNNPALKVRVVAVFDPEVGTDYSPSRRPPATPAYLSSGNHRMDNVRVLGTAVVSVPPQVSGVFTPSAVCRGSEVILNVTASPGQNPLSESLSVTADLTSLGGSATQALDFQGGNAFTTAIMVAGGAATGFLNVPVTVSDNFERSSTAPISVAVGDCSTDSGAPVVISMVNGGGGNAGSIFNADFVEVFNRSCTPVSLEGWSLQYTSAGGANTFDGLRQVNLTGVIQPGQYLLIQTQRIGEGAPGLPIPAADILAFPVNAEDPPVPPQTVDGFGLGNDAGRLALCRTTTPIGADCGHPAVVDLVGYGVTAFCYEGVAPTGNTANTLSAIRKSNGCQDTNQGFNDFEVVFPRDPFNASSPVFACQDCPPPGCAADFNADGNLDPDDLGDYINCYFGVPPCAGADFNSDGSVDPDDLGDFINAYFAGC